MKEGDILGIFKNSKVTIALVSLLIMTIILSYSSQVKADQDGDYTYTVTSSEAQITRYTGAGGVVTIPSSLGGFSVTSIGDGAFDNYNSITTISIPQGVTSIGNNAFNGCTGLTSITLPQGVTSIGMQAFSWCTGLTTISIPQGVTSIGDRAFAYCSGLTSITVDAGNLNYESIGGVLYNKAGTSLLAFPGGLTTFSIPQEVTTIGEQAFYGCSALTSIIIPVGVTSIGNYAFWDCTSLTSIRFNSATTTISNSAITIPVEARIIGYDPSTAKTYATNNSIMFEVIPSTTTLQSITITTPAIKLSYTVGEALNITGLVVTGTYSDNSINVESITNANITGFNSSSPATNQILTIIVLGKTVTYPVQIVAASEVSDFTYTVTAGETQITGYTGAGLAITIPSTLDGAPVTSIGDGAFDNQNRLTSISIPQGVTSIGNGAFNGCLGLTSINIPQGVTSIGMQAFNYCTGLTTIFIPQTVTSIGDRAFAYCSGLTSIAVDAGNLNYESIGGVLFNKAGTSLLAFPGGLTTISIPQEVTTIGEQAFYGCSALTSIIIPVGVTSIGNYAFWDCTSLTSIRFNSATTTIPDSGDTIPSGTKIIGYDPSIAKDYATKYNRQFEVIATVVIIDSQAKADAINGTTINYPIQVTMDNINVTGITTDSNIIVTGNNDTLNNVTVNGNGTIYLDPGQNGVVTLQNVTAQTIVVLSGGQNSIYLINVRAELLRNQSSSSNVRIHLSGGTIIENTESTASAIFDAEDGSFGSIILSRSPDGGVPVVSFKGNFSDPIVVGGGISIIAASGANIPNLNVEVAANQSDQTVTLTGNFNIVTVNTLSNTILQLGENTTIAKVIALTIVNIDIPASSTLTLDNRSGGIINITGAGQVQGVDTAYTATPIVRIGINPNYGDSAGIFVGLKDIRDAQGNIVPNPNLAGYQIDINYDHNQVKVLDVNSMVYSGYFIFNSVTNPNITSVADVVYQGTTNFEKLFFVPLALTGTSTNSTNVIIKFNSLSDQNLNHISIPDVTLTFQRGKIYNEAPNKSLSIADAIAGLQYLAGSRNIGLNQGEVNLINMASILPPEVGATTIRPSVRDIVALMQKLVGLRDDSFQLVPLTNIGANTPLLVTSATAINADQLKVVFNESVNLTSATSIGNYQMINTSGIAIPITDASVATLQADKRTVIITLDTPLKNGGVYTFKVSGVTAVNLTVAPDYTTTFIASDTTAPTLVSATATANVVTNTVTITFSEPIDATTASVTVNGVPASFEAGSYAGKNTVTVTSESSLITGTAISLDVRNFQDFAKNTLAAITFPVLVQVR